jgi:hypothetical protein
MADHLTEQKAADFFTAAVEVLRSSGRPLTTTEITQAVLEQALVQTTGKTPQKTMDARLYLAVRDDPDCPIERVFGLGEVRARRGSVRWRLRGIAQ